MHRRTVLVVASLAALLLPFAATADSTIKVGFPMALSGPAALYGQPVLQGAQMYVAELNAKGGVLGKKIELLPRDTKANADEAVRVSRELILKDNVDFLVGSMTSAESPAVSTIAKENKIVFVAPMAKTIQLTDAAHLHPYVNRIASTTDIEGRAAAVILAKWAEVKKVATIAPDYAYGRDVMSAFIDRLKELRPDIQIVDQQWPKLGQADFTPFITAQMSKQPDAVFSAVFAGDFASMVKQAKPLGYFDAIKSRFLGAGETGSIEIARALGPDYPFGIVANTYDPVIWLENEPAAHKDFIARVKSFTKDDYGSSWPVMGYVAMQALVEGIRKAGSTDEDKVAKAMVDLTFESPFGPQTLRAKDHTANRSEYWGKMVKDPKYPFAIMTDIQYPDPTPLMN
jgi:branched-chain amino acid transport system substrate-binding protein